MKAIVRTKQGPPEVLKLRDVEKPVPTKNEVLIKVHASTVTTGDVFLRNLHPLLSIPLRLFGMKMKKTPGHEFAGVVEAVGEQTEQFKVGDQVFGTTTGSSVGANAEYVCLPEERETGVLAIKPANISYEEAAAVPVGGMTALNILGKANIQKGQKVLIHGASGSVGSFAVQIAKHLGAEVTGVCSTKNVELVRSLGADQVIDYTKEDFTENDEVYDVIFDAVGKISAGESKSSLQPGRNTDRPRPETFDRHRGSAYRRHRGGTIVTLWQVRTRVRDIPGKLAQLATALGAVRGNVVGIDVHGCDLEHVHDDLFVDVPETIDADRLAQALAGADDADRTEGPDDAAAAEPVRVRRARAQEPRRRSEPGPHPGRPAGRGSRGAAGAVVPARRRRRRRPVRAGAAGVPASAGRRVAGPARFRRRAPGVGAVHPGRTRPRRPAGRGGRRRRPRSGERGRPGGSCGRIPAADPARQAGGRRARRRPAGPLQPVGAGGAVRRRRRRTAARSLARSPRGASGGVHPARVRGVRQPRRHGPVHPLGPTPRARGRAAGRGRVATARHRHPARPRPGPQGTHRRRDRARRDQHRCAGGYRRHGAAVRAGRAAGADEVRRRGVGGACPAAHRRPWWPRLPRTTCPAPSCEARRRCAPGHAPPGEAAR